MTVTALRLEAYDFKVGDFVVSRTDDNFYIIIATGNTLIHGHDFVSVFFPITGKSYKWTCESIRGKRTVYRMVEE